MSESNFRLGVVTAFPPGKNSLNEFGWQLVTQFNEKSEVTGIDVFSDITDSGDPKPIEGVRFSPCWKFNSVGNIFGLLRAIKSSESDFVLFNLQFASFGDSKVAGGLGLLTPMLTRLLLRRKVGVVLHNLVENVDMKDAGFTNNKLMSKVMSFAGRLLTKAILKSDYVALTIPKYVDQLQDGYGASNALLAPHGTFEEIPEPDFVLPEEKRLIAFGKWGTYKTVEELVEAYRVLDGRGYGDVTVEIAGTDSPNAPGYLAAVEAGVEPHERISFTGYIEEEDVAPMFLESAIAVFPYTSTTGSSGVLHQAGSYGKPVVLPDIGDFAEVIESEGFVAEYFEPGNGTSLADAIERLLTDTDKAAEQGRQNYLAAAGIPFAEVLDWHIFHIQSVLEK